MRRRRIVGGRLGCAAASLQPCLARQTRTLEPASARAAPPEISSGVALIHSSRLASTLSTHAAV